MRTYGANEIRNVLLVGHAGAGKTTLLEAMLFTAGAITRMGTVEDGNTVSDHDPDEQRRQHLRLARDGARRVEGREDQRARCARHGRLRRRSAQRDPRRRRRDRGGLGGRRRRGADRVRVGARGRGGPPARDLRQQARPRARRLRGDARPAGLELRQPGRAIRAADRRRAGVPRDRRPAAREGRPVPERPDRPRSRSGPRTCTRWPIRRARSSSRRSPNPTTP